LLQGDDKSIKREAQQGASRLKFQSGFPFALQAGTLRRLLLFLLWFFGEGHEGLEIGRFGDAIDDGDVDVLETGLPQPYYELRADLFKPEVRRKIWFANNF
jgi:hypothetical protein